MMLKEIILQESHDHCGGQVYEQISKSSWNEIHFRLICATCGKTLILKYICPQCGSIMQAEKETYEDSWDNEYQTFSCCICSYTTSFCVFDGDAGK
jgi:hypothetical protein